MAENSITGKTLVFTDQEGTYYAIPAERLESYRVPEEHKAQIEQALGGGVEGYGKALAGQADGRQLGMPEVPPPPPSKVSGHPSPDPREGSAMDATGEYLSQTTFTGIMVVIGSDGRNL